ncbi:isochorismatase family cysteine hydrolase [Peribacillus alkalitolerans]|uniref:isochorismatase family cysteine hydrolase n=1 Tax=Peribacillus alkalitolerans TaxID=1550385 RepID=UPI0013D3D37F|nr:isochorismatase family cysteine hydrolase [Peribacillus alkalitolerans]
MPKSDYALIIIDIINDFDFTHGDLLLENTQHIIDPLLQLKLKAKEKSIPIIYVNDHYNLWQANFKKIIDKCKNENNSSIIEKIAPDHDDFFLIKPKHSGFYGTALNTLLYHLGAKKLILTGIAGNICVLFTANDAYMREYSLLCPSDCIASADQNDNEYALRMMTHVLKANTNTSKEITF